MEMQRVVGAMVCGLLTAPVAFAQDVTFKFNNPSFGGNSFNSTHLLSTADLQNQFIPSTSRRNADGGNDATDAFIRRLESRLLSSIADDLVTQITGAEPGTGDTVAVGDQQIQFERTETDLTVVITNLLSGGSTELVLPTLLLDN